MPKLEKAELIEIEWDEDQSVNTVSGGHRMSVQFNPESLTVNYTNQKAGGDQRGGSTLQSVGQGSTKLALELWFDVNAPQVGGSAKKDVRELTKKVTYFATPVGIPENSPTRWKMPGVRFIWGSFLFEGVMDTLNEKLDFFSEDGHPLRAMVSVSLSSVPAPIELNRQGASDSSVNNDVTAGTQPLTSAAQGQSLQQLAAGLAASWQEIARANGIESPRQLNGGTLLNLNVRVGVGVRRR